MATLPSVQVQSILITLGLAMLTIGGFAVHSTADLLPPRSFSIDVSHARSFGLMLSISQGGNSQFLEISHDAQDGISLTLPTTWREREVRFVPLSTIRSVPNGTSRQWTLPPKALVSFRTDDVWNELMIRNTSESPFKVHLTLIDLRTGTMESDVYLVKDDPLTIELGS